MSFLKHSDYIPLLRSVGSDWMVVSDGPIVCISRLVEPGAVATFDVVMPFELADASYSVVVQGEGVNDAHVDESTKTTVGFTVLKAAGDFGTGVANIMIMGSRKATQPEPF